MRDKPNIIIIITDQQNSNSLSCYGSQLNTPHIDELAKKGVKFSKHYVTSPLCVPSRASIWTSLYPHQLGILKSNSNSFEEVHVNDDGRDTGLPADTLTIGDLANANGYSTAYFGKWHLGNENSAQHGFNVFKTELRGSYEQRIEETGKVSFRKDSNRLEQQGMESFELQEDTVMTNLAIDYIRGTMNSNRPFFVVLSFRFPHDPYTGPFDDYLNPMTLSPPFTRCAFLWKVRF